MGAIAIRDGFRRLCALESAGAGDGPFRPALALELLVFRAVADGSTVDQLRLFLCVAEEGSFSAGGRRLGKTQSAVSYGISQLEQTLGVRLFSRDGRKAALTDCGRALIEDARGVLDRLGRLTAHAAVLASGGEGSVRVVVDTLFPGTILAQACCAFHQEFPNVRLHVQAEVRREVVRRVLDGSCDLGVGRAVGGDLPELDRRFLANIALVPVAAAHHPLARIRGEIPTERVRDVVQIIIAERNRGLDSPVHTILSRTTWRVADVATKLALIRGGLGWGNVPVDMVGSDVSEGRLVKLALAEWGGKPVLVPMSSIARVGSPAGPATAWLRRRLELLCLSPTSAAAAVQSAACP